MTKQELILDYIKQFHYFGINAMAGHSYHFTLILRHRFGPGYCTIMYDETYNYFATKIEGRIYDICGDITDDICYKCPVAVPCVRLDDGASALHTDRCHSLWSLHLPQAALPSLPSRGRL